MMMARRAGLAVGGAAAAAVLAERRFCDAAGGARPSYFAKAAADSSAVGDKKLQGKCFAADIASWTGYAPPADAPTPVPPHPGRPTEGRGQSLPEAGRRLPDRATLDTNGSGVLRFVTWNVNNLMGLGGEGASHENVLAALKAMDADVIVLQESCNDGMPYTDEPWEKSCLEVAALDAALRKAGYELYRSASPCPTLLASRLPVVTSESIDLDAHHENRGRIGVCAGRLTREADGKTLAPEAKALHQHRAALYAELELSRRSRRKLGLYATHLHHSFYTDDGQPRRAEVAALLADRPKRKGTPALVLGDLNQPRKQDMPESDWAIVRQAKKWVEDDGVAAALVSAGLVNAWDAEGRKANYKGAAPPTTHWSGCCVDYVYVPATPALRVDGAYLGVHEARALSDHLPVIVDVFIDARDFDGASKRERGGW